LSRFFKTAGQRTRRSDAMNVKGSFEVKMTPEPPYDVVEGVSLARARFDKTFTGPLEGTSTVAFLSARTSVATSAGYVALERVDAVLEGRRGTFVVVHTGLMNRGVSSLTITIVPDSGTGDLTGISGKMGIEIVEGKHVYELDYEIRC
jgi:hypothetical protein